MQWTVTVLVLVLAVAVAVVTADEVQSPGGGARKCVWVGV